MPDDLTVDDLTVDGRGGNNPDPAANPSPNNDETLTAAQWTEKWNKGVWRETLPEDLATSPSMSKFNGKGFDEVVKSYVNLEKHMGNKAPKPNPTWKKAEWDEWNKQYNPGYPQAPTEYELKYPEGDVPWDTKVEDFFRQVAHENGLTREQARRIFYASMEREAQTYTTQMDSLKAAQEKDVATLKRDWGAAFDDKLKAGRTALQKFASPELLETLRTSHIDANVWKFLATVGEQLTESRSEHATTTPTASLTPNESTSKAKEYMRQAHEAMTKGDRVLSEELAKKAERFYRMAETRKE